MISSNISKINEAFSAQAANFGSKNYHLLKADYLDYVIKKSHRKKRTMCWKSRLELAFAEGRLRLLSRT